MGFWNIEFNSDFPSIPCQVQFLGIYDISPGKGALAQSKLVVRHLRFLPGPHLFSHILDFLLGRILPHPWSIFFMGSESRTQA